MKHIKLLSVLVIILLTCGGITSVAVPTDVAGFVTCNIDGVVTKNKLSKINFTVNGVQNTDKYAYVGIDIGIFKRPSDYNTNPLGAEWQAVNLQRVFSNSLNFDVNDFGDYSKYEQGQVYTMAYRVLYLQASEQQNIITESQWRRVDDSSSKNDYFTYLGNVTLTDRVTGANNWIDAANADKYNKYTPGSEIVCKLTINPKKSNSVDEYGISMNLCDKNELNIDYVKLLKVDVGNSTVLVDSITVNKKDSNVDFKISNPKNEVITVYFKYKISKRDSKKPLTIKTFDNTVNVSAYSGTVVTQYESVENTINVLDANIIYG